MLAYELKPYGRVGKTGREMSVASGTTAEGSAFRITAGVSVEIPPGWNWPENSLCLKAKKTPAHRTHDPNE